MFSYPIGFQAAEIQRELNAASLASGKNVMEVDMVKCSWAELVFFAFRAFEVHIVGGPSTRRPSNLNTI